MLSGNDEITIRLNSDVATSTNLVVCFISNIKYSHTIFIRYGNARLRLEFVYQIKISCSCFIVCIARLTVSFAAVMTRPGKSVHCSSNPEFSFLNIPQKCVNDCLDGLT